MSSSAAVPPSRSKRWRTVVSGGEAYRAASMSSNPTSAMSWDADARLGERVEDPERLLVGRHEHRGAGDALFQQALHGEPTARPLVVREIEDEVGVERDAALLERVPVGLEALPDVLVRHVAREDDPLVPVVEQVAYGREGATVVVGQDVGQRASPFARPLRVTTGRPSSRKGSSSAASMSAIHPSTWSRASRSL